MKKKYKEPVIEKIVFDYTEQVVASLTTCSGTTVNTYDESRNCTPSPTNTPIYIGWNSKTPIG